MEIKKCILTNNDCYRFKKKITPAGIVVHSTGANNPYLKRYVQPDDGVLGVNSGRNDWNHTGINKCVHGFIGKDKNGVVRFYQTLPFDVRSWGCGTGSKGSYNNSHIQFEICEDGLNDEAYFNECFKVAIDVCKWLMSVYNIKVENVVSHHEAHLRGYGSNHADCDHWLKKFNKNMDWLRSQLTTGAKVEGVKVSTAAASASGSTSTASATASAKEVYNMPVIKKGSKGNAVKIWQIILGVTVDGVFGANTEKATIEFQSKKKLTVDGVVGSQSWKAGLDSVK